MKKKKSTNDETLSILEHLRKEIPEELPEGELELPDEDDDDEDELAIPTEITGQY